MNAADPGPWEARPDSAVPSCGGPVGDPFKALLARLAVDGRADLIYEDLRRRLIRFFRLHVPTDAEALADVSLDRLARKLHQGVEVAGVRAYTLGIARMVLHETNAKRARQRLAEADPLLAASGDQGDDAQEPAVEVVSAALSRCLQEIGERNGSLILAYYGADGAQRIRVRQRLAEELGSSLNALRNRALRLRETLERCVRERMRTAEDIT